MRPHGRLRRRRVRHPFDGGCEPVDTCGNGVIEGDERCDDGGTAPDDSCSPECLNEAGGACTTTDDCAVGAC